MTVDLDTHELLGTRLEAAILERQRIREQHDRFCAQASRVVQGSGQSLLELNACMARAREQLMKHAMEQ